MKRLRSLAVLLPAYAIIVSWSLLAQGQAPGALHAPAPASYSSDPMIQSLKWRHVGNANLIGRISAIDALENDFTHVIVGRASGGVFKSISAPAASTRRFRRSCFPRPTLIETTAARTWSGSLAS